MNRALEVLVFLCVLDVRVYISWDEFYPNVSSICPESQKTYTGFGLRFRYYLGYWAQRERILVFQAQHV